MKAMSRILLTWWSSLHEPRRGTGGAGDGRDRGDVPGWVMVTVMTAALVTALMIVAVPTLRNVFTDAINSVTGGGGGGGGGGAPGPVGGGG